MSIDTEATWLNAPTETDPPEYDAGELRRADGTLFAGDGSAFGVLGGIVPHGPDSLKVTVDGSDNMT
ncbi:MAG: hypothetical protein ACRDXB_06275, partial [Actinomycetes bacterium]